MAGGHGGGSHERWLITYADLLTLLLAFFIVLYSTSSADIARFRKFQQSVQQAFNVGVLDGQIATSLDPSGGIAGPEPNAPISGPETPLDKNGLVQTLQKTVQVLAPAGSRGGIQVVAHPEGITISIYGVLLFESGKATLSDEGRELLLAVAERVRELPYPIRVEGHTDNIPPEVGPYPTNWELSTARSLAVTRVLIDAGRIDPSRINAAGYAEFHPVASNETREGRLRNRRVDLILLYPDASAGGQQ